MRLARNEANRLVDQAAARLNGGSIKLLDRDGNLLAEPRFADEAFGAAVDGEAKANPILSDPDAKATGKAVSYQLVSKDGEVVGEGLAGKKAAEGVSMILTAQNIQQHAEVSIDAYALRYE